MLKKNFKYLLLVMTMILAVLSCGKSESGGDSTSGKKNIKVGVIYTKAKLGGNSFNDLVFEGVKRETKEETGCDIELKQVFPIITNGKNIIISISNKANFINRISAESEKYKLYI